MSKVPSETLQRDGLFQILLNLEGDILSKSKRIRLLTFSMKNVLSKKAVTSFF